MADKPQVKATIPILPSLNLDETSAFYAEYVAQGIERIEEPAETGYDIVEFSLADPPGNVVRIGSQSKERA